MFRYSQLQRFRKGKNLKVADKYKPELDEQKRKEVRDRENQWYRENVLTEEQKAMEQKSKVEKGRYIKALKELIREKSSKLTPLTEDMPALCSCGALSENIKQMQAGSKTMTTKTISTSKSSLSKVTSSGVPDGI